MVAHADTLVAYVKHDELDAWGVERLERYVRCGTGNGLISAGVKFKISHGSSNQEIIKMR